MANDMDKARLAAFIDGELSPEEAAEVVMHLADHPADQAYVDELMALNVVLADAYDAPLHEPVPVAILAAIHAAGGGDEASKKPGETSTVIPLRPRVPPVRRFAVWGGGLAIAASIAAVAVFSPLSVMDPYSVAVGPIPGESAQEAALIELAAGETRQIAEDVEISLIATYRTATGGVCREFEVARDGGARLDAAIACLNTGADGGWRIEVAAMIETATTATDFTPASGNDEDPLNAFLDQVGAGPALSAADEEQARAEIETLRK